MLLHPGGDLRALSCCQGACIALWSETIVSRAGRCQIKNPVSMVAPIATPIPTARGSPHHGLGLSPGVERIASLI
jgi:hypothetical protein